MCVRYREMVVMKVFQVFLIPLILVVSLECCNGDLNDDVLGLVVFKSGLRDPFSYLESWNEDDNSPCSWTYVKCNPVNGRVNQISLDGLDLSGKIGRGLLKVQNLEVLSLSHNNFTGNIPQELYLMGHLENVNLSHNSLSGRIPSLITNSTIKFLDLSSNSLSGPLGDEMFENCFSLRYLSLSGNFLEGPIPSTLSRCTSLSNLNLSNNHFSGTPNFASGIWTLTRLRTLDLSRNAFSGPVPVGVSAIHNLKDLGLHGNHFSGLIPTDIGLCPHLSRLELSDNLFTGSLPNSLQRLTYSLTFLSLSNNKLTGDFPEWLGSMQILQFLDLSGNGITGKLPSSMANLKSLTYLNLADNNLYGPIPESIAYCTKLSMVSLSGNIFNGSVPKGLFDLALDEVDLSGNELTGPIPSGSTKLFNALQILDLSANKLRGEIPAEIGLFSKLRYLNLSWNNFESRVPPELGYFQNLTVLDLRNIALVGPIPGDICDSGSLGILQLDGNSLTGPIPDEIHNCSSLYLLSLSHNNLSGSIPKSISMLKKLKILKLEVNQLSGEIPQELGNLENLLAVNISYNRLTGKVPTGAIFQNLDQSALQGNLGICSPLLKGPCKLNVPKPLVINPFSYGNQMGGDNHGEDLNSNSSERIRHHKFLSISAILAILAAIAISVGVIVISLLNISARRRLAFIDNSLESMGSSTLSQSGNLSTGKLILFDAKTSSDHWMSGSPEPQLNKGAEIGGGAFGTVYKASFGESEIAIKKLVSLNIIQHQEDFDREVRILGKARHPNLLSLKGYYWTPQLQLLVSEFAHNGSLQDKLHDRTSYPLSWPIRFKIMLGTAKGLAHLHHSFRPPIIHYNIKPSNILLDHDLNPMVSDFGLARLLKKLDNHVITSRFESSLGYVAPELACQSLRVNEKCDIYGFGVLIMEMVTGRRAVEYGEENVVVLKDHVRIMLEQGNVLECVDNKMGDYPEDEVLPVLKLALVCTSQIPSSRPSMSEVVQILQVIKTPIPHRMESA